MKTYKYVCIKNKQREGDNAPEFLMFRAKAGDIQDWAAVEKHTAASRDGPQRLPKPAKVAEIKRFLEVDQRNTLATAMLVSLKVPEHGITPLSHDYPEIVRLEFSFDDGAENPVKPGMVVDGQHRLLGGAGFDPNLPLNVVALINVSDAETAFQFLVVNNKASRVSSNHLRALALEYTESSLKERLRNVRMSLSKHLDFVGMVDTDASSPFRGKIDWPNNQEEGQPPRGFVAPNAIESCIAYIKQKRIEELEDDAILLGFYLAIWTQIAAKWPNQFNKNTHLLEKAPVVCLTQYIVDNIAVEYDNDSLDVTDFAKVSELVGRITDAINPQFWETKWSAKGLDTAAGRNMLIESLSQIRRNHNMERLWYENVPVVDL